MYRLIFATCNEKPNIRTYHNKKELIRYIKTIQQYNLWYRIDKR